MSDERIFTAAVIIIGNEVLSGRVTDANLNYIAIRLKQQGIRLREARVIPDVRETIIDNVNTLRREHDYVFTTGGIGPTHDDITAESVAGAFEVALIQHPQAMALLKEYYGDDINPGRLRMANIPQGGELLDNPVSWAPGFQLGNVFVLPGVPSIMQAMFDGFYHRLAGGRPVLSRTVNAFLAESLVAEGLAALQTRYPETEIGSYPYVKNQRFGCALVVRSARRDDVDKVSHAVAELVRELGGEPEIIEGEGGSSPAA